MVTKALTIMRYDYHVQAKGGSFAKDKDFYRFTLGRGEVIPAVEEAVASMKEGGIRRIVVPVELGYPNNDMNAQGPTPTTFSVSPPPYGHLCPGARTTHILCDCSQRMFHPSCKVVRAIFIVARAQDCLLKILYEHLCP